MASADIKEVTVICDTREDRSGIPAQLARLPGVTVEKAVLTCGDYAIGTDHLGIERKTAHDFCASILDGRLMEQIARLTTEYEHALFLIEGDIYSTKFGIESVALDGALSYIAFLQNLKVLHTPNTTRSAALLHRFAIHAQHGLGYEVPLRSNKPKNLNISAQFLLEGLPACGPTAAQNLLAHFGTPAAVFAATAQELKEVKGVGPKTIDKIRAVLEFSPNP